MRRKGGGFGFFDGLLTNGMLGFNWTGLSLDCYCTGQWVDGPGDPEIEPDDWYHSDVSLGFGGAGSSPSPRLAAVTVSKSKKSGEQGGDGQTDARPEAKPGGGKQR